MRTDIFSNDKKPRQKNERQKNGVWHHASEVDDDRM
jgi:hypothetical protein